MFQLLIFCVKIQADPNLTKVRKNMDNRKKNRPNQTLFAGMVAVTDSTSEMGMRTVSRHFRSNC